MKLGSLLDSIGTQLTKIHNGADILIEQVQRIPKEAHAAKEEIDSVETDLVILKESITNIESKLTTARKSIEAVEFEGMEMSEIMDNLHDQAAHGVQYTMQESRDILVANDINLFVQSAGNLEPNLIPKGLFRLDLERLKLILYHCEKVIGILEEGELDEKSPLGPIT